MMRVTQSQSLLTMHGSLPIPIDETAFPVSAHTPYPGGS